MTLPFSAAGSIPPEALRLRQATAEDAPAIASLIASLAHYFLADASRPESASAFFETVSVEAIARYLMDPPYRYHVAEADGVPLGVVGVRDGSHLYHLFVAEPFHRRGIAAMLWRHAYEQAQAAGRVSRFTVNSSRFALPLYERLGFHPTGPLRVQDGIAFVPMERIAGDAAPR